MGLRLVASDPVTGKPLVYDAKKSGDERFFRPFQLSPGFFGRGDGEIAFIHSGAFPVVYSVYFDRDTAYTEPFPAEYPPVGVGYPVMLGTKEHPEQFGGGLRGAFALHDFDGDGAPDLLFLSGNQTDSGRDLWSGLYFHRNLRKTFGFDCFGPPELVDKGNNPFGHFRQTAPPRLVDLDGDGRAGTRFRFAKHVRLRETRTAERYSAPVRLEGAEIHKEASRPRFKRLVSRLQRRRARPTSSATASAT